MDQTQTVNCIATFHMHLQNILLLIPQIFHEIDVQQLSTFTPLLEFLIVLAQLWEKNVPSWSNIAQHLTLLPDGKCRLTLTNSPRVKTELPTNVRIIFDSDSFKLKQVSIV